MLFDEGISFAFCGFVDNLVFRIGLPIKTGKHTQTWRIIVRLSYQCNFSFLVISQSFLEIIDSFRSKRCNMRKIIDKYAQSN